MITVYTWQGNDFDLFSGIIDQSKSRYAESVSDYLKKIEVLNQIIGSNQYLWAFLNSSQHQLFEICKPVEWVLEIANSDILGYVNNPIWEQFLYYGDEDLDLNNLVQQEIIDRIDQSALVRHPIEATKIRRKRIYEIKNPYDVKMLEETIF